MTKKELAKNIAEELNLHQQTAMQAVQRVFDGIIDALATEGRIELRNFGVFEVKRRKSRKGRNPRSGEAVDVPERLVVRFKSGKEMEEQVSHVGRGKLPCTGRERRFPEADGQR